MAAKKQIPSNRLAAALGISDMSMSATTTEGGRSMRKSIVVGLAALLLAGCGGTTGSTDSSEPAGTNADSTASAEPATDQGDGTTKFGGTYTYEDGLSVTVSTPKKFKPSEYAFVEDAEAYVAMTVKIVNKTGKPYDPSLFYATMQSGNEEAEQVFDSENDIGGSPDTKVLNGREVKFKIGYGVKDPKDLVLEVNPESLTYDAAIFTS